MEETLSNIPTFGIMNSLQRVYRKKILSKIVNALLISGSVLFVTITISSVLELVFEFNTTGRTFLFFLSVVAILVPIIRYLLPNLAKYSRPAQTKDVREISLEVGNALPEFRDRLRNAVELLSDESNKYQSSELARAYIEQIFEKASHHNIDSVLRFKAEKRAELSIVISFAVALVPFLLLSSQLPSAFGKVLNFTQNYTSPNAYSVEVSPGDAELCRGDSLKVETKLGLISARQFPSHVILNEKYDDEREFEKHQVKGTAGGKYYFQLPNVRSNMEYFVTVGDQKTQSYHVKVVDLPIVQSFTVTLVYPAYTQKAAEILQDNIGDFSALVGTRAEFTLKTNKDLKSAWILFSDTTKKIFGVSGTNASGEFIVNRTAKYTLRLLDADSLRNRDPIVYTVQAVNDEYPTCEITFPGKDLDLSRDMQLPLRIRIGDDYGFTRMLLEYKLVNSKYIQPDKDYRSIEIQLPTKAAGDQEIAYTWDLTSLDLVPEDVISYHAKVFDNDLVNGPKATASSEYELRLPSLDEVFASTDSEHSDLISKTENALNNSRDLKEQLDKLSQDMKSATQQMSWEQQKKMQSTLQKYEDLQKKVDSVRSQVEAITQKMLENKIISPQTLEKYLELEKAMQEINSPEFQDALRKLQQAIQSLNPEQVRQAMQNFQINEEALRQAIEHTLNLIKRVEIEQKLDELQKRAEQMLSQQENIQNSTAESDSTQDRNRQQLSENQKEAEKEFERMKEAISDLKERMNEFAEEMPMQKLDEAKQDLDKSGAEQSMQKSAQQLSQGKFTQAMSSQQQVSSALRDFQKTLSEAQKEMLQNQQKETVNAMRKAQQNLLEISKKQEELRDQSAQTIPNSAEARSLADEQYELMQELNYTAQQMMQLSDKSFAVTPQMGRQMGQAYSQMQDALNDLQQRTGQSNPTGSQSQAMGSLNQAVMSIQNTLQAMMQGQGAGSFPSLMQQLQQLAGQQEGLNSLTQKLGQGGALSMEQQAELARLAAQQEAIHKSLEQLAQEAQSAAGGQAQNRVLGDLDQIAKDMKDVVKDLEDNNIKPETIQRQEKILARMLDASRSINKRDYDERRQSSPGHEVITKSPKELNLTNTGSEQDQELLKLIRQNFPPEYQKVILRYYEIVKKTPE